MKYWMKNNGDCGTIDNNGFVPDSIEITEQEYLDYINNLPIPEPVTESDIDKLIKYAKKEKWI